MTVPGTRGNANEIKMAPADYTGAGDYLMASTLDNTQLIITDLNVESAPAEVDRVTIPAVTIDGNDVEIDGAQSMFQASSEDMNIFIVVGVNSIATFKFDPVTRLFLDGVEDIAAVIDPFDQLTFDPTRTLSELGPDDLDPRNPDPEEPYDEDTDIVGDINFRGAIMSEDGSAALVVWFSKLHETSGAILYAINDDGILEELEADDGLNYPSRMAIGLPELVE